MPTGTLTPLRQLLADRLGEDPVAVIAREYPGKSYRTIAAEMSAETGVDVSYETIRRWSDESESNRDPAA